MAKGKKKPRGIPFKKGESGNLAGRPNLKPEALVLKKHTRSELIEAICKVMTSSVYDNDILVDNPYASGAEVLMASILQKGIKMGCPTRAQFFMSYLFGRPKEYDPTEDNPPPEYSKKLEDVPSQAITRVLKELQANAAAQAQAESESLL